ncbi:MAG TPA: hypothetical protein VMV20_02235 [Chitinophagaceae bacterium]|nr:hypothetical protein [Chitinophagaceae bacterium]
MQDIFNVFEVLYDVLKTFTGGERSVVVVDDPGKLDQAMSNLSRLDTLYEQGTVALKRQIIGSIYPEKLTFDGNQYRTNRLNEAVRLIYTMDKGFSEIKNRKSNKKMCFSGKVPLSGLKPDSPVFPAVATP